LEIFTRPEASQRVRLRFRHKDGSWVWLEITNHNHLEDPADPCVLAENVDVTDEVTAQEALRANERLLRRLTEALPVGVLYVAADGSLDYGNERLATIVGVSFAKTVEEQFATAVSEDRQTLLDGIATALRQGRDIDLTVSFRPKPDTTVHCDVSLRALVNDSSEVVGAIACISDVTEDLKLREELRERATYDLLTGCLNHAAVMSELAERLSAPSGELTVALFIDVDDFKGINDRYGHAAGDHVLRHVAHRLRAVADDGDLVGRLGGDEFLMVTRCPDASGLADIANRVAPALGEDVEWRGERIFHRASIGLAYTPAGSAVTADRLVSSADAAMYESKRRGAAPMFVDAAEAEGSSHP
jgi:diguanylate cyclase (GGDEF)-like protein/PAS domain S-box-containing protein